MGTMLYGPQVHLCQPSKRIQYCWKRWLLCHACEYESNQQEYVARQLQSRGGVYVCLLKHIPLSYNTANGCRPPRKLHVIMDANQDFC